LVANLNTIVAAGIDTTMVSELPRAIGMMIALRVVGAVDELVGNTLDLHSHVEAPDQAIVSQLDHAIGPIEAPAARQDWPLGLGLCFAVQWEATMAGTYMVHIRVDQEYDALPMHVVLPEADDG